MLPETLEKLEQLVNVLILESQKIRGENRRLKKQVKGMSEELSNLRKREAELDEELALLSTLKSENRKMHSQKEQIKNRVNGILDNLERIDFF